MRVIFAGTPEFAAKALEALIQSEHEVVMVLSQPDRPAGRGRKLKESAVKALAKQHNIPVYTPLSLRVEKGGEETAEVLTKMQEAKADVLVVAAYGLIVPQFVLDIPSGVLPQKFPMLKAVNIHGSLLPEWRGAAPIARAIERGDKETGITLMQMDAGLDTGPMLMKRSVEITPEDTAGDLTETLSRLGAEMLIEYLRDPEAFPPLPQPEGATYASKLAKAEGKIDWTASADKIADKVRAFNPVPGCFRNKAKKSAMPEVNTDRGQKGEKKSGRKRLERGPNGGKTAKCRAGVLGGPGAAQGRGRHFRLARLMAERMARRGARLML